MITVYTSKFEATTNKTGEGREALPLNNNTDRKRKRKKKEKKKKKKKPADENTAHFLAK